VKYIGITLLLLTAMVDAAPYHQHHQQVRLAPGYGELEFVPPAVGSYKLPSLGKAADAEVLLTDGHRVRLHSLLGDKFVLLSFIYTTCTDVNGCPLASYVLSNVQKALLNDPVLKDYVRLISFSFDPANDTPKVLADYASNFRSPDFDWQFLTATSDNELDQTLLAYNQFIIRDYDEGGQLLGSMSHMLRVYLIDQHRDIRNIYSVSFLHPDIVMNDIRTIVADSVSQQ